MRIFQHLHPRAKSRQVAISGKKVHQWSLKFVEHGLEKGFAQSRTQDVLSGLMWMIILTFLATLMTLAMFFAEDFRHFISGKLSTVERALYSTCLFMIVVICIISIWAKFPRFHKRMGPLGREVICCSIVIFGMVGYCCMDAHYMARICGRSPWDKETWTEASLLTGTDRHGSDFTDSRVLLMIEAAVTLSHFLMPIRWCIMTTVPVAGMFVYMGFVLGLGSPEVAPQPAVNSVLLLTILIGMSLGKRSEEWRARCHFAAMIQEKQLRCASEFKLERVQRAPRSVGSGSNGEVEFKFGSASSPTVLSTLQDIASVGRQEHWLLEVDELTLLPEAPLGHGSFGTVISGSFQGTLVAVKIATPHRQPISQSSAQAMANELRVLRQVRHRNIVAFHGACVFEHIGGIGLVLEYIRGGMTLDHFMGSPKSCEEMRPIAHRCEIVFGICCALRYLHSRRPVIIHGDLKGSNIMIETGPNAKLLDFGLSRVVTSKAQALGGSLRWSAPEIIMNTCSLPSAAADVFSFGRLLHLITAGERPFDKLKKCAILRLVAAGQMSFSYEPIQDELALHSLGIVRKCLSTNIASRPSMKYIFDAVVLWPKELNFQPVSKHFAELLDAFGAAANTDLDEQFAKLDELILASRVDSDSDSSSLCAKISHLSVRSGDKADTDSDESNHVGTQSI